MARAGSTAITALHFRPDLAMGDAAAGCRIAHAQPRAIGGNVSSPQPPDGRVVVLVGAC